MKTIVLLTIFSTVSALEIHEIFIYGDEPHDLVTPGYPDMMEWNQNISIEWNLKVESDSKIKVTCTDIRMVQIPPWKKDCPFVYFSIKDKHGEQKYCQNRIQNLIHKSEGPSLKVRIVTTKEGNAIVKCIAEKLVQ